ncbi:patatin-like phospholipase family protein [Roseibium sp.]|uniref:patatin-like phospholipase family protein n=1 Tax=Roseibium sp. TaxID=1936156 RepID=UPI003BABCB73
MRFLFVLAVSVFVASCAPNRPPALPTNYADSVMPWGVVDIDADPPAVVLPGRRVNSLPSSASVVTDLRRGRSGSYEYPVLSISGGGSHGAWGAGFLKGWSETGTRPDFRVVTAMSVGALLATPAFLGPEYDRILTRFFVEGKQSEFYRVGPGSIIGGLLGSGHFADNTPGLKLLKELLDDTVIDAIAREYRKGRRLYVSTANFDNNRWTLWDLGAIAASGEPDRYHRYRQVILAAIAVPAAFPPVYFPVEVAGKTYGQMHLDAGTNFVFFGSFMTGTDAAALAEANLQVDVEPVVYALMNTQREPNLAANPSGAPLELAGRAYQRIGRFASYAALDRLWVYATERDAEVRITYIPDDLPIPFDVFEFPQPQMSELFDEGRRAAAGYQFLSRPPDLPPPPSDTEKNHVNARVN